MKRLRVILLFLLLGTIVNVAVALRGFQLSEINLKEFDEQLQSGVAEDVLWLRHATAAWPEVPLEYRRWNGLLADGRELSYSSGPYSINIHPDMPDWQARQLHQGYGTFEVTQTRCGFPLRSMRTEKWVGNPDPQYYISTAGQDAFIWSGYRFPKHLIWPGFIIDIIFFAILLRLLIPGPFVLRRFIRHKRGLCVKCAYDLRGAEHEACPECGTVSRTLNSDRISAH